jgi:Uncharacterized protein conserved in bacteria (DUF2184)
MLRQLERRETAMDAARFLRSFDNIGRWSYDSFMSKSDSQRRAMRVLRAAEEVNYGFDAASGAGLAFLASQLELPEVELVEPLASVTHPRDITIITGGGYVEELSAWAANYGSAANNNYGIQDNKNLDIGIVQVEVLKGLWPAVIWAQSQRISYIDLKKLMDSKKFGMPAPYSLQELLDDGLRLIWNKAMDQITYFGVPNTITSTGAGAGLMNNPLVTSTEAPQTGTGNSPLWSNKTTTQILNDLNYGLLTCQENSGYDTAGIPDRILVDYEHWSMLNQPMTTAGTNSVLEYFYENNVAKRQGVDVKIFPLPDPWIATEGTGSTSEILFYRNDKKSLYLKVPQPMQKVFTVPSVEQAAYSTLFMGCIGCVQWVRPQTALYLYGV